MPLFFVFFTFFLWSTSFSIGKVSLEYSPPLFLTGVRMLVAGIIILGFLYMWRRETFKIKKRQILPLLLLSFFSVYLTNALEFWGLQYLTAAKACFIYSLSPFLSALFSYFQFKEKITSRKVMGLVTGFLGFFPVLLMQSGSDDLGGFSFLSLAEIALVIATICSVYGWIILRKLGKDDGMSPLMANGSSMALGGVFALVHSMIVENWNPFPVSNAMGFLQGIFMMILISNLICYNLYGWLLKRFTATFLSFAGLTTPLFAAFFGWIFLKEEVSWVFFLSVGIISIGLWIVYAEEFRLGYIAKKAKDILKPTSEKIS